jgi:DNA-binding transcriptional ArsR family regulator
MQLLEVYQCLCDLTRLRILALLNVTPLCVCHFQTVLKEDQVKISKHLSYLKKRGLVLSRRNANWMVYRLPVKQSPELIANLKCLQDGQTTEPVFVRDHRRLQKLLREDDRLQIACCVGDCTPVRLQKPKNGVTHVK